MRLVLITILLLLCVMGVSNVFAVEVYWSEGGWYSGAIHKANLDGSNRQDLVTSTDKAFSSLAIDYKNSVMYYGVGARTTSNGCGLWRANLDGSNPKQLIQQSVWTFYNDMIVFNDKLYTSISSLGGSGIGRYTLDGKSVVGLVASSTRLNGIAIDAAVSKIYYTKEINSEVLSSICVSNLDGSGQQTIIANAGNEAEDIALDLVAGKIYWTDWTGQKVRRANLDGSSIEEIYSTQSGNPYGITLDLASQKVYWTEWNSNCIKSSNLDGSNVNTVFTTGINPWNIIITPEPTSVMLLGLGCLGLRKKKRRD